MKIIIEKRSYSLGPWRLVDEDTGRELYWQVPYPGDDTLPPVFVSGHNTKTEAIEFMGVLLGRLLANGQAS